MQFRIYVRALITNTREQFLLMQKQSDQKIAAGKWLLPGGAVEFGETPPATLKRELKEETNLIVEDHFLLGTETIILGEIHWLGLYYRVSGDVSIVKNLEPEKHAKLEWCTKDFARSNLSTDAASFLDSR